MATVTIGGLVFSAGDATSPNGFYFVAPFDDWWSLSDNKTGLNERNQADGAFGRNNINRAALPIEFNAWSKSPDRVTHASRKRQVNSALGTGRPMAMTLVDVDGTTTRTVTVESAVPKDDMRNLVTKWTIDLTAEDPLAYGPAVTSSVGVPVASGGLIFPLGSGAAMIDFGTGGASGRVALTNAGTARTYPQLQITGGLGAGFVLTDITTNQVIRLDRQVPLGSTVFINQRTGRVYLDAANSDIGGFVTSRDFFSIGPGETHQIQFQPLGAVTGTPMFTAFVSPAFR